MTLTMHVACPTYLGLQRHSVCLIQMTVAGPISLFTEMPGTSVLILLLKGPPAAGIRSMLLTTIITTRPIGVYTLVFRKASVF